MESSRWTPGPPAPIALAAPWARCPERAWAFAPRGARDLCKQILRNDPNPSFEHCGCSSLSLPRCRRSVLGSARIGRPQPPIARAGVAGFDDFHCRAGASSPRTRTLRQAARSEVSGVQTRRGLCTNHRLLHEEYSLGAVGGAESYAGPKREGLSERSDRPCVNCSTASTGRLNKAWSRA